MADLPVPDNADRLLSDAQMGDADQIISRPSPSVAKRRGSLSTTSSLSPTPDVISRPPHVNISPYKASTSGPSEPESMGKREQASSTMPHNDSDASLATNHAGELGGPSPYGTRSRNRTGSSRPNYAEDREPDMDYELSSSKKNAALTNALSTKALNEKQSSHGGRRSASNTAGSASQKSIGNSAPPKDYIPGMSSFSVNMNLDVGGSQPSKKRKTMGVNGQKGTQGEHGYTQASHRKSHITTPTVHVPRSSNVYSFENSQGYLRNGKLQADDGTIFELNGMPALPIKKSSISVSDSL